MDFLNPGEGFTAEDAGTAEKTAMSSEPLCPLCSLWFTFAMRNS